MTSRIILDKVLKQTLKNEGGNVAGSDVIAYLIRHVGYYAIVIPVIGTLLGMAWTFDLKDRVKKLADEGDKKIIVRVDTLTSRVKHNEFTAKETYYTVKKMELVQSRTSPKNIVLEAEEEIEIEKEFDKR